MRNKNGEGTIVNGYRVFQADDKFVYEHRAVAEKALGKPLPPGAVVHHVDGNRLNNAPNNLVICPDAAYHRLIHYRERARDATGDPNKKQCKYCKNWDDEINVYYNPAAQTYWHRPCRQEARRK